MVTWALVVFAVAAVAGLTMAIGHFKGRTPAVSTAVIHGTFAATGLVLLLLAVFKEGAGKFFGIFRRHVRRCPALPPPTIEMYCGEVT